MNGGPDTGDATGVPEEAGKRSGLHGVIDSMARAMVTTLSAGDVAALRRLDAAELSTPAFWKVVTGYIEPAGHLAEAGTARLEAERRWAVVVNALALLGTNHRREVRLGRALALAEYSELRLVRLVRATGPRLGHEVRTAVRFLVAKSEPVDATEFARLVLSDGTKYADQVRRDVARAYYTEARDKEGRS